MPSFTLAIPQTTNVKKVSKVSSGNVKVTARSMGIVLSSIILTVRFLQGRINVQISSV